MKRVQVGELRIGNYVLDAECEPYFFEVEQIAKYVGYELWAYYRKGSIKTKEPQGIPLTEEWFNKFEGVTKSESGLEFKIKDRLFFRRNGIFVDYGSGKEIHFVHRLQNFVYELTDTELELKTL